MFRFLQRLTATLTAAAVVFHLLCGCCQVAHAEPTAESHEIAAAHECEHHHDSHPDHDEGEPCSRHCSMHCSPATVERSDAAVPAPFDVSATLPVATTLVVEFAAPVRFVESAYLPAPPQSLPILYCALRN